MDGKTLYRIVVQQSIVEAFALETLLRGVSCMSVSAAQRVSFKAYQWNMYHCGLASVFERFLPDFLTGDVGVTIDEIDSCKISK